VVQKTPIHQNILSPQMLSSVSFGLDQLKHPTYISCTSQTWGQLNSGIGIDGQFQFRNWLFKKKLIGIDKFWIGILEFEVSYKTIKSKKFIYHFYNVNTYMWCHQYTGTIMIHISNMHTDCGTPSEHLATMTPPHSIPVIYIDILLFRN